MATESNNILINTFTKGMNTDTSLDMVPEGQYIFGKNIRISTNTLLNKLADSNSREGIVTPVPAGIEKTGITYNKVLATASIENIGAVIVTVKINTSDDRYDNTIGGDQYVWRIYRVDCDNDLTFTQLFESDVTTTKDKFSIVLNKELEDVINLYIADGEHLIMLLNLLEDDLVTEKELYNGSATSITVTVYKYTTIDLLMSNHYFPNSKLSIVAKIQGILPTSQVLYSYRFYKKHGIRSKLSPLTNKILIINDSRSKETGNAEDTLTQIGLKLQVNLSDSDIRTMFDHLQIYRLTYKKVNTDAEVDLIYDAKLPDTGTYINYNDDGLNSKLTLSIEEYASLDTLDIYPKCIEQNLNYLFAANIKDNTSVVLNIEFDAVARQCNSSHKYILYKESDTLYSGDFISLDDPYNHPTYTLNKYVDMNLNIQIGDDKYCAYDDTSWYYGGTGKNVSWRFITTQIPLHTNGNMNDDVFSDTIINYNPPKADGKSKSYVYYLKRNGNEIDLEEVEGLTTDDVFESNNICSPDNLSYDNIFVSSMIRSLRRDEVYRYGVVLYDKNGDRTDVKWIADIRTPSIKEFPITKNPGDDFLDLVAYPLGIQFTVNNLPDGYSYQIVRCAKLTQYTKNLLQCIISRPMRLLIYNSSDYSTSSYRYTPYYPNYLLTSLYCNNSVYSSVYIDEDHDKASVDENCYLKLNIYLANNLDNDALFLIYSPEIYIERNDLLQLLQSSNINLTALLFVYQSEDISNISKIFTCKDSEDGAPSIIAETDDNGIYSNIKINRDLVKGSNKGYVSGYDHIINPYYLDDKASLSFVLYNYKYGDLGTAINTSVLIEQILDVQNPTWELGFSNIQLGGDDDVNIISGVKQYKSFGTSIKNQEYVNWVCNNMYDLRISDSISESGYNISSLDASGCSAFIEQGDYYRSALASGWTGPGPVCMLIKLKESTLLNPFNININITDTDNADKLTPGTILCNIQNTPVQYAGLSNLDKQYDIYYGFGNFSNSSTYNVFDGDVYDTMLEVTLMYKAYDFNSRDTLPSALILYYTPIESTINTCFDYGMNYRNTQCKTLQLEPGEIVGVTVQDRPEHQYNMIYSNNNISNDIFNAESLEDSASIFPQRIFFSELKTNGEAIDSYTSFKTLNYIDADTRYGQLTDILSVKDVVYFWLTQAFGKLSVNERSLITDNNSNTIQLGQGGVLQRTDYIDTIHGMGEQDFAAVSTEGGIFWIDILNKAIMNSDGTKSINYGEAVNVLNYINHNMIDDIPTIHNDVLNKEVLCKAFKDGEQLVFSTKAQSALSVYTRKYDDVIVFSNVLYGLLSGKSIQYNYLSDTDDYLTPTELAFVINQSSSDTKVFDSQEIVILDEPKEFFDGKSFEFKTNLYSTTNSPDGYTDREGNIKYSIPRYDNLEYGSRLRGKWMTVDITDTTPKYEESISHVLTTFRKSFS